MSFTSENSERDKSGSNADLSVLSEQQKNSPSDENGSDLNSGNETYYDPAGRRMAQEILKIEKEISEIQRKFQPTAQWAEQYLRTSQNRPSLDKLLKENSFVHPTKLAAQKIPPFYSIQERPLSERHVSTRFITFINLKGGVGKTTLSANLAAAFSSGNYHLPNKKKGKPLKVLAVDLDFQGTLSQRCLSKESYSAAMQQKLTSSLLLEFPGRGADRHSLPVYPFINRPQTAAVIPAEENLDAIDYRKQALLSLNQKETRYYYRLWFHHEQVFQNYDLVIFDCPPRLTTSSVCALVAADYAFIPSSPELFDTSAVSRTISWIGDLQNNLSLCVRIAGIILNRTNKAPSLSQKEHSQRGVLESKLKEIYKNFPNSVTGDISPILNQFVPRRAGESSSINGAIGEALPGEKIEFFGDLASEIYQRIY